eukprot:5094171-Amphidinium_carterae.2
MKNPVHLHAWLPWHVCREGLRRYERLSSTVVDATFREQHLFLRRACECCSAVAVSAGAVPLEQSQRALVEGFIARSGKLAHASLMCVLRVLPCMSTPLCKTTKLQALSTGVKTQRQVTGGGVRQYGWCDDQEVFLAQRMDAGFCYEHTRRRTLHASMAASSVSHTLRDKRLRFATGERVLGAGRIWMMSLRIVVLGRSSKIAHTFLGLFPT